MKSKIPLIACAAAIVLASGSFIQAASITANTVGVVNTNAHTIIDATGSISNTTFASNIGTAFANNTGGVWDFDTQGAYDLTAGQTITLNYGVSAAQSLVLTLTSGGNINQASVNNIEQTSGTFGLGLSDSSTRVYTPDAPLITIGMFIGNRGDSSRVSTLTVTFMDDTTATVTGGHMGPAGGSNYFQGVTATGTNYIKSFTIAQTNFVRYDDLGFIVAPSAIPEPSTYAIAVGGLALVGSMVRRRRANAAKA